jgi:hypothetical protein
MWRAARVHYGAEQEAVSVYRCAMSKQSGPCHQLGELRRAALGPHLQALRLPLPRALQPDCPLIVYQCTRTPSPHPPLCLATAITATKAATAATAGR